ncbi:MAG: FHA domain-containing protein, partial [Planctomycetota bacterium]
MELQLHIKSVLPDSSSEEKYFDITAFFSQAAGNIESPKFWIGRKRDCQIRIADDKISRHHCHIEKTPEDKLKLIDNNSSSGCFVNMIKVSEVILNEGDDISIGHYEMVLSAKGGSAVGTESPAGDCIRKKKEAFADIPKSEISLPRLRTAQKTAAPKRTFQLLTAVFIIIMGLVFLMVLFRRKDNANNYVENTNNPSSTGKPITTPEPAVSSLPQVNIPVFVTSVTPVSKTDITPKPPTADDLTRKNTDEFEKQQQALKVQEEKEETERQAKLKAEQEAEQDKQAALKRRQEEQKLMAEEKLRWSGHKTKVASLLIKYQYANAIESLNVFLKDIKTEVIKTEINGYIEDLQGEYLLFKTTTNNLVTSSVRKKIVIDNRTIWITKADEIKFEGSIAGLSGSVYTRQWADIPQDAILDLFPVDLMKTERFYLATFCYNHNLTEEGDRILLACLKTYPDEKWRIDRFLSRYKDIPLPEGGFYEYQGQLVTAEEKSYLDKGYVKYQGKWISYDEMMSAKGFVKLQNKWVTPEEQAKMKARLTALSSLQKLLAPTGAIDKPGADNEKLPWEQARTKETEHYIIKTNLSVEALNDICYVMECHYCEAKKTFKLSRDSGNKLKVFVFREAKEYYDHNGIGSGVYFHGEDRKDNSLMTFYQPTNNNMEMNTTGILLHEGTHQFVDLVCNVTKVPIWINEGLATYYESSEFEGTSLKTNIINKNRLLLTQNMIMKKDVPSLEDIINIRQANFAMYEYAQAWSLVYFFMNYNNGQYADELETYFEAIKKKGFENRPLHKQLFENAFKVKFEVLEKQWE